MSCLCIAPEPAAQALMCWKVGAVSLLKCLHWWCWLSSASIDTSSCWSMLTVGNLTCHWLCIKPESWSSDNRDERRGEERDMTTTALVLFSFFFIFSFAIQDVTMVLYFSQMHPHIWKRWESLDNFIFKWHSFLMSDCFSYQIVDRWHCIWSCRQVTLRIEQVNLAQF